MPYKTDAIRKAVWANRNKKMKKKAEILTAEKLGQLAAKLVKNNCCNK